MSFSGKGMRFVRAFLMMVLGGMVNAVAQQHDTVSMPATMEFGGCDAERAAVSGAVYASRSESTVTAIVGATLIDGTGAPPIPEATVVMTGRRLSSAGPRATTPIPAGARIIDGRSLFVLPGFVDANVHISLYGQIGSLVDTTTNCLLVRSQYALRYGVTTLRDTYGMLRPLQAVRDSIDAGDAVGARLLVAGNVIGWSEHPMPAVTQGAGSELVDLEADKLRVRINQYLDQGMDFVKYGATQHGADTIIFDGRAQRVIVEEAHQRGVGVDVHALSPQAMRLALLAGVDVIQHPEVIEEPFPEELIGLLLDRKAICSMNAAQALGYGMIQVAGVPTTFPMPSPASHEYQRNAERLIRAGCTIAVASDLLGGETTLQAIEALVQLGMTPMDALVSATANGAKACKRFDQFGTITAGKFADLVILRDNPLADIRNIRHVAMVFKEGQQIE